MRIGYKILLFILSFAFAFTVALGIAGYIFQDTIIKKTIEHLNTQLDATLKVKEIRVSLITAFPRVSVTMRQVEIIESHLDSSEEFDPGLLSLEEVNIRISLIDIIKKQYNIEELILRKGWLNLYFDNSGAGNFEIFKESDGPKGSWLLDLKAVKLYDVELNYTDLRSGWRFKGQVDNASIHGKLSNSSILVNIRSNINVSSMRQGVFHYIRNQRVGINTEFLVNELAFEIKPSEGTLGRNSIYFFGNIGIDKDEPVRIEVKSDDFDIETLLSFLSQYNIKLPANTQTKGFIGFNLLVNGRRAEDAPFKVKLDFFTKDFYFQLPGMPSLTIKHMKGAFDNGSLGRAESSELYLSDLSLQSGQSSLEGSLRIKNIVSPLYHLQVKHLIYLPDILKWNIRMPLKDGVIYGDSEVLGLIDNINAITLSSFENSKYYSNLELRNIVFEEVGHIPPLKEVSGNLKVNNQDISNAKLKGNMLGSNFEVELSATNATALVFGKGKASINASVTLDSLNTEWFLASADTTSAQPEGVSAWDRINFISGDVFVDQFVHGDFKANPLSANIYLKKEQLFCNSFLARACGGMFTGRVGITPKPNSIMDLMAELNLDGISIEQLFRSFNNFEQTVITSKNISGQLDGTLALATPLQNGATVYSQLDASANVKITNGRLINIDQLNSLSRFIEVEELKDIKFSTIENSLRVKDETIVIPEMDIQSSAMNLALSGTHSFSGEYLYRFNVVLSDVLFGKASKSKAENSQFGVVEDDGTERMKLFLKLEGNSTSSKVSYDGAKAREAFKQSIRQERENLRSILREEFSFLIGSKAKSDTLMNVDTLSLSKPKPAEKPSKKKKEDSTKFTIEWD